MTRFDHATMCISEAKRLISKNLYAHSPWHIIHSNNLQYAGSSIKEKIYNIRTKKSTPSGGHVVMNDAGRQQKWIWRILQMTMKRNQEQTRAVQTEVADLIPPAGLGACPGIIKL